MKKQQKKKQMYENDYWKRIKEGDMPIPFLMIMTFLIGVIWGIVMLK